MAFISIFALKGHSPNLTLKIHNWTANVIDLQGENGKLELAIVGFADTFEISPSIVNQDAQFVINVKNNKRLDFEQVRQMNFKIVAQELGVNKLSTSADVSVNILDVNDNKPQFTQNAYEFDVAENEESGTIVGKVTAFDEDSQENGEIAYRKIVSGNSPLVDSFDVEAENGNIMLTDNTYLDREQVQSKYFTSHQKVPKIANLVNRK